MTPNEREAPEALLPCPFCGYPVGPTLYANVEGTRRHVVCLNCGARTREGSEAVATENWNRRSPSREALLAEGRRVGLEEAAKMCDRAAATSTHAAQLDEDDGYHEHRARISRACAGKALALASDIRARASKPSPEPVIIADRPLSPAERQIVGRVIQEMEPGVPEGGACTCSFPRIDCHDCGQMCRVCIAAMDAQRLAAPPPAVPVGDLAQELAAMLRVVHPVHPPAPRCDACALISRYDATKKEQPHSTDLVDRLMRERDEAQREALEHQRGYEGAMVLVHELQQERDAATASGWNAAIMTAATAVEDTDVVEARGRGIMGSYYAQLGDARATLAEAAKNVRALRAPAVPQEGTQGSGVRCLCTHAPEEHGQRGCGIYGCPCGASDEPGDHTSTHQGGR